MGANITEVDYDGIMQQANKIAKHANEMQKNIKEAFDKINSMSEHWFGNSYDNFVRGANLSITGLNTTFMSTVVTYPLEIAAKAKSLAAANQSQVNTAFPNELALQLEEVPLTNKGSKLRFKEEQIKSDQAAINNKFDAAMEDLDNAVREANGLKETWQSVSGDNNIRELVAALNRVKGVINGLKASLDSCITAQAVTVNALEAAAQVVDTAGDILDNTVDAAKDALANTVNQIQETAADIWRNLTGQN